MVPPMKGLIIHSSQLASITPQVTGQCMDCFRINVKVKGSLFEGPGNNLTLLLYYH